MTKRILIVEDSDAKLASVMSALRELADGAIIDSCKSVKSALRLIKAECYSLIVCDMSLPTYDVQIGERGGTARPFGGIEIFDYLLRKRSLTPVVVVSSYPAIVDGNTSLTLGDLALQLSKDYSKNFVGYVFFDSSYLTWKSELFGIARKVINNE